MDIAGDVLSVIQESVRQTFLKRKKQKKLLKTYLILLYFFAYKKEPHTAKLHWVIKYL